MVWPFAGGAFLFFIFWGFDIFVLSAQYLIGQHEPFFVVLRYLVLRVPQSIPMAFPFGALAGSLLAMGRLMADNEVTAMRTAGIHVLRIAATPLLVGFVAFLFTYGMNEYVAPRAVDLSTRTFYQMIYHSDYLPFDTQFFRKDPDTGNTFYVTEASPDGKTFYGVQIFKPGPSGTWNETLQAKSASVINGKLVMKNVIETRFNNDGYVSGQQKVATVTIGLPLQESAAQFLNTVNNDPWAMSSKQLATQLRWRNEQGIGGTALDSWEFTLGSKLAWPFACFIAVLVAVPLAIRFGRRGRMLGMLLAVVAFFCYYILVSVMTAFGNNGAIDPYLAAWIPNIIMGAAGGFLLWLEER
jgi:lipopolysaccharide export system permease protein